MKTIGMSPYDALLNMANKNTMSVSQKFVLANPINNNMQSKSINLNFNSPKNSNLLINKAGMFVSNGKSSNIISNSTNDSVNNTYTNTNNTKSSQNFAINSSNNIQGEGQLTRQNSRLLGIENNSGMNQNTQKLERKKYSADKSQPKNTIGVDSVKTFMQGKKPEKEIVSKSLNIKENIKSYGFQQENLGRSQKKLEISTDISSASLKIAKNLRSLTTKNRDIKDFNPVDISAETTKNSNTPQSLRFMARLKKGGDNLSSQDTIISNLKLKTTDEFESEPDQPSQEKPFKRQESQGRQINSLKSSTQIEKNNANFKTQPTQLKTSLLLNDFLVETNTKGNISEEKGRSNGLKLSSLTPMNKDNNMEANDQKYSKKTIFRQNTEAKIPIKALNDENKSSVLNIPSEPDINPPSIKSPQNYRSLSKINKSDDKTPTASNGNNAGSFIQKPSLGSFVTKVSKSDEISKKLNPNDPNGQNLKRSAKILSTPTSSTTIDSSQEKTNLENAINITSMQNGKTPKSSNNSDIKAPFFSSKESNKEISITRNPSQKQSSLLTKGSENGILKLPNFIYYMPNLERSYKLQEDDYFSLIYRDHFIQTYQAMSFCNFLKPVDSKVLGQKKVTLEKREAYKNKKTLIFDLDETLIHCNEHSDMPCDVKLPIRFPSGECVHAGINIRPFALEILKELSPIYEIIVFTASHSCYANVVLDYLDPKGQYIHHRLFRETCVPTEEGVHIKDLRIFANRNLDDLIIVDNAAYSFGYQIENGIPIIPFYDNKSDEELKQLIPYLKYLSTANDLREVNKQYFRLSQYNNYNTPDEVLEKVVYTNSKY